MKTYSVFQQLLPKDGDARFEEVGEIKADTGAQAIDEARKWSEVQVSGPARFPVVAEKVPA